MFLSKKEYDRIKFDIAMNTVKISYLELCLHDYCDQIQEVIDNNQSIIDTNKLVLDKLEEIIKVNILE